MGRDGKASREEHQFKIHCKKVVLQIFEEEQFDLADTNSTSLDNVQYPPK